MELNNNQQAFFILVKAGLWVQEARLSQYNEIDYAAIMKLAEEQSVVGLVTAGLEMVIDVKVPNEMLLQFIGSTLQIEQQNQAMNAYVAELIEFLRKNDVYAILVKGQGIAQCYEKPLWRVSGDIDLLLSRDNYEKAKRLLIPIASSVEDEDTHELHLGMQLQSWSVELHGSLRSQSLDAMDRGIEEAQNDIFYGCNVRPWMNGRTSVFLPSSDNDIIFVFTHIIKHFFRGGIGLRQLCDWCRLLRAYRDTIDVCFLEKRLCKMKIMSEWKTFASLAVNTLGMPEETMPFYSSSPKWRKKANKVLRIILETGSFGKNIDSSYLNECDTLRRKLATVWHGTKENLSHFPIFPLDSFKVWCSLLKNGSLAFIQGKR